MRNFNRVSEYLHMKGYEGTGIAFHKGDIRFKFFFKGEDGDYNMLSVTSLSKSFPKTEWIIDDGYKDFIDSYDYDKEYNINEFKVDGLLLDKEEMPYGSFICNVEISDRGGQNTIVPIWFYGEVAQKIKRFQAQERIKVVFKMNTVFRKAFTIKIVALDVY